MNGNSCLKGLSLSQNASFSEDLELALRSKLGKGSDTFGFEPHYNLHPGISKYLKGCNFKFVGSDKVRKKLRALVQL